jgi:cytochrome c-type biogenesis protein CcmH/NrfF
VLPGLFILLVTLPTLAQESEERGLLEPHEHSDLPTVGESNFSDPERKRLRRLETGVMCACPRENWSRTLTNCPDSCADPQKKEIRALLRKGRSDAEILADMERAYGSRVLSAPGWSGTGKWSYLFPFLILGLAVGAAGTVIVGWVRRGGRAREEREAVSGLVTSEELARVDRELEGID